MKKPQLFLMHFAGGNCYSFQFMTPLLKDFETISLELPGRGRRINEPLLTDFNAAARDVYDQLTKKLSDGVFLIYGHSLGSYLALRVANMLEKAGLAPAYLIVSGNAGPGIEDRETRYSLGEEAFIDMLQELGGIPPELLKNKELLNFFMPILRADFELAEKNEMIHEPAVNAPLYAIMGNEEEEAKEIANWARFTKSTFSHEVLEGDHFFIHKHPAKVAGIIRECKNQVALLQHP